MLGKGVWFGWNGRMRFPWTGQQHLANMFNGVANFDFSACFNQGTRRGRHALVICARTSFMSSVSSVCLFALLENRRDMFPDHGMRKEEAQV